MGLLGLGAPVAPPPPPNVIVRGSNPNCLPPCNNEFGLYGSVETETLFK